jgi:hypothetical protein
MKGTIIRSSISPAILNGLKTVKKQRTHIGSNEFRLAMLPVPKNPTKIKTTYSQSRIYFLLVFVDVAKKDTKKKARRKSS